MGLMLAPLFFPFPHALFLPAGGAVAVNSSSARAGTLESLEETLGAGLGEVRAHRSTDWERSATGLGEVRAAVRNGLVEVRTP